MTFLKLSKFEKIHFSVITCSQADINCMSDLINIPNVSSGTGWRYLINTAGQAFPLRTNEEIVSILRLYSGTNDLEGKLYKATMIFLHIFFIIRIDLAEIDKTGLATSSVEAATIY